MASNNNALSWNQAFAAPIVIITGKEELLVERAYERIRNQLLKENGNHLERVELDAGKYTAGSIATQTSPSLFAEPKLLRIINGGSGTDAFFTEIGKYLESPADQVWVVIQVGAGRRGQPSWNLMKKKYSWVDCPELKWESQKADLVRGDVRSARRKIEESAVHALVRAAGSDIRELAAVTGQLLSDLTGEITEKAVREYFAGRVESNAFDVADAVAQGRMATALVHLRQAIEGGASVQAIIGAIAAKMRNISLYAEGNIPPGDTPRRQRELRECAAEWTPRALAGAISAVALAGEEVNGGSRDQIHAVEKCLITCCRLKAGRI
ncbi:DNA polymerase III subunit delta [Actinomycetaceae bacterium TAE3-ERU4]|nr:DNA polymerase III subunit delta [Actinomycetaceae bacterium TAE3-ERU4]